LAWEFVVNQNIFVFLDSFEGTMVPSRGQAALLTFCTCISLGSVGLVLSIAVPEGGNNWFWLMTLSPLAYVSEPLSSWQSIMKLPVKM